jgi:predicted MPP superfamily phosphohydrolase
MAVAGRNQSRELILLAHQPKNIFDAAAHDVGLQLSGHTHGGQTFPFHLLVYMGNPYNAGLYHHSGSRTQIYVSRGSKYWGPPLRLFAPHEVTEITLRSVSKR